MVTTALGTSRIWITLGHGIINEVYWPATGTPQIRDLGFIVAGPPGWFEVKRVKRYGISIPRPYVPLPQVVHEHEHYQLALEVLADPQRDSVVISFRLSGKDMRLYALLAPHLANSGEHNSASAGEDLVAWRGDTALCLTSDCGFSRSSAGYVGVSDGWQDFSRNGRMTWTHDLASDGNVALLGELQSSEGTLVLGLSNSVKGARTKAHSSLSEGYKSIKRRFIAGWEKWGKSLTIPDVPAAIKREAYLSAVVLKVHEDRSYPGAVIASLSVPWGSASDSSGGYHLVWARDCVEAGLALFAVGQTDDARSMLSYLIAVQNADGSWNQNSFPDGNSFWTGIQLDEAAFPIILAAKLAEQDALAGVVGVEEMARRAARFIVRNGPISAQDRWEENSGISPFTLAIAIVSLVAAAQLLDEDERDYLLSLADYWNERIEDWTYVAEGSLAKQFGVDGHYVRIGPAPAEGGLSGYVEVHNRLGLSLPAAALVGMEYLQLARLGLRAPRDPRVLNTLKVTDGTLKVETPNGVAYHRYNGDGYGEREDGGPFDGIGIGRAWPLLTGERGHFEILLDRDPLPYLETMSRMTSPSGLIPEQVWDGPSMTNRGLETGQPTGGAMPLVWAHAEFLKLVCAREQGRPIELLRSVEERYRGSPAKGGSWHWRVDTPFAALPADRDLLIEAPSPFRLHLGFDGWQDIEDRPSTPSKFGTHSVRLTSDELGRRGVLDFTMFFSGEERWENQDHHVRLPADVAAKPHLARQDLAIGAA
jgi:glucoamylase